MTSQGFSAVREKTVDENKRDKINTNDNDFIIMIIGMTG